MGHVYDFFKPGPYPVREYITHATSSLRHRWERDPTWSISVHENRTLLVNLNTHVRLTYRWHEITITLQIRDSLVVLGQSKDSLGGEILMKMGKSFRKLIKNDNVTIKTLQNQNHALSTWNILLWDNKFQRSTAVCWYTIWSAYHPSDIMSLGTCNGYSYIFIPYEYMNTISGAFAWIYVE